MFILIEYIDLFLVSVKQHFLTPSLSPPLPLSLSLSHSLFYFLSSLTIPYPPTTYTHTITATKKPAVNNDKEDDTVDDLTMSPTDAEELLAGLEIPGWDTTVQADMISPNWQQKADAVTLIGEKIAVSVCVCVCVCM